MGTFKNTMLLIGRLLFSVIFIEGAITHLTKTGYMARYAGAAGVPYPEIAIIITGLMLLVGSLSIVLGWKTALGSILLIIFLVPVTYQMHFLPMLHATDPMQAQMQMINFLKNTGLMGGAIYIAALGPGRYSIDGEKK
ncbi:MAG: DoxX family protein [Deltaproteobacteria bacterium]|nr:DoxX family protein [Deltaproteobacteria bacterium]MCL5276851.1 DoxX family protein [Deltaproteobacteria bacterium]